MAERTGIEPVRVFASTALSRVIFRQPDFQIHLYV